MRKYLENKLMVEPNEELQVLFEKAIQDAKKLGMSMLPEHLFLLCFAVITL